VTRGAPIAFAAVANQLADRGWRPFPGLQSSKTPAMRGWPGLNHAEWDRDDLVETIADYQPADDFCCCLAVQPQIVAIDLDITDTDHAAAANKLADGTLGRTPLVRIGLAPKQIRLYRSGEPLRSRKLHPLEIFSGTGQFIGYGWHEKAGRPYIWPQRSPLDLSPDSNEIPLLTRVQLDRFSAELFKIVPRRLLPTRQSRPTSTGRLQTIGERLAMLSMLHSSWKRAAAIVLSEAVEGCRNDTAWTVVTSAAGRGIPDDVVWDLFDRNFRGWAEVSEAQVASMIERARPVRQPSTMIFTTSASSGGVNGDPR
jgi:hypothetical protein